MEARVKRLMAIKARLDKAGIPVDELAELIWFSLEDFVMAKIGPLVRQDLSAFVADEIRRQLSRMEIFIPDGVEYET
jgi:hypothetical protein